MIDLIDKYIPIIVVVSVIAFGVVWYYNGKRVGYKEGLAANTVFQYALTNMVINVNCAHVDVCEVPVR